MRNSTPADQDQEKTWWETHPEDYGASPVSELINGPREFSPWAAWVKTHGPYRPPDEGLDVSRRQARLQRTSRDGHRSAYGVYFSAGLSTPSQSAGGGLVISCAALFR